jgi:hypothetical protein
MMQQVQLTSGYTTPVQTNCSSFGYTVNCFTTGGQYVPPASIPIDMNQSARNSAVRSCLFSAGWQPVKDHAEAAAVTNAATPEPPIDPAALAQATDRAKKYCDAIFNSGSSGDTSMRAVFGNYSNCVSIRTREIASTP